MGRIVPIQFVTPLPPLRTGIAQYSRDLLLAIDGGWPLMVYPEAGSTWTPSLRAERVNACQPRPDIPTIFQLGNSEFHQCAFDAALRTAGVAVLHDVVLHHGLLAVALARGRMSGYWREVWNRYGTSGYEAGRALLRGEPADVAKHPLCERYIERSVVTVVHNRFAERAVRALVPGATVERIPMGIPLPALVNQVDARRVLGLPESAFIVASITHINPHKRLPVVLRAIKRLAARLPETLFVVAGSSSPAVDVARQVRTLGLDGRVIVTGYVEDRKARLIAAASDACVNLRHPPSGETSASLLRLLGAAKPVLVTDGAPSEDLPPDVGLRVPVDRLEEEFIADLLFELATNDDLRRTAGAAGRRYVEECHSMGAAVEGYRRVIRRAFGIDLPALGDLRIEEPAPWLDGVDAASKGYAPYSCFDSRVGEALDELGLGRHEPLIWSTSRAMVELGLDRLPKTHGPERPVHLAAEAPDRLRQRIACPNCYGPLGWLDGELRCPSCRTTWSVRGGVPDFAHPRADGQP